MDSNQLIVPNEFPVVTRNPNSMPLPGIGASHFLRHPYYEFLIQEARGGKVPFVFVVMQRPELRAFPKNAEGLYQIGMVCSVEAVGDVEPWITLFGGYRVKVGRYIKKANDLWVASLSEPIVDEQEEQFVNERGNIVVNPEYRVPLTGLLFNIRIKLQQLCQECVEFAGFDDADTQWLINLYDSFYNRDFNRRDAIDQLIWDVIFAASTIDSSQKQHFIEQTSLMSRIGGCLELLELNIDIISSARKQDAAVRSRMRKRQRRSGRNISKGGGSSSDDNSMANANPEIAKRWGKYQKIKDSVSPEVQKAILEEFGRLNNCHPEQVEWSTFANHLDCLLNLYSTETTPQEKNISKVEEVLGQSHFGLEDIKKRIYDYLGTKIRNPKGKAPILCFVGPPGVGKTSIGKSVAESLGLKFVRLSLGGIRDEADIRGHRQTYIGSVPGKIVQEIIRSGVRNPVFMLDEVDKISSDFRGDPSSALLEVLDPEQNHSFQDHYVGAPFDLRDVLFLCTANTSAGIQPALLDRMAVIEIAGYTEFEKIQIAIEFLVSQEVVETGFPGLKVKYQDNNPDGVFSKIIKGYTREAGVRNLKREIRQIFERWGRQVMKDGNDKPTELLITEELVEKLLGAPRYTHERVNITEIGEAIGLAWTPVGGDIMYIQTQLTPHGRTEKDISQTGNLGKIFEAANKDAFTVIKNRLRNDKKAMRMLMDNLFCVSVPEGAIPKDGPSAGISMTMAMYSRLTGRPLKPYVAMSGEIDILERVHAVGGIKEKVLAAYRDGVKEIILPVSNERDVKDQIPEEIKKGLKFHFVSRIDEVLPIVFPSQ